MTDRKEEAMETAHRPALEGLDRILALRPDDLDGWEEEAADGLQLDERRGIEADDAVFASALEGWLDREANRAEPSLRAADFVGLPQIEGGDPAVAEAGGAAPTRRRHRRGGLFPAWAPSAALAASLAIVAFAAWQVDRLTPDGTEQSLKEVTPATSARVELQFSVERSVSTAVIAEPGREGASYGTSDRLALRAGVTGDGGWLYLFEVADGSEPQLIWPAAGSSWQVEAGMHALIDEAGHPRVWQPDTLSGPTRYLAVLTSEPIDAGGAVDDVLGSEQRPDLWPRAVLAVDSFTVEWEASDPH